MKMINRRRGRVVRILLCVLMGVFLLSGLAVAAETGGHGGEAAAAHDGDHGSGQLKDLLYRFINFALLVIILVLVIRKTAIKDYFAARAEEIKRRLADLQSERDTAEARYRELEEKLREFESRKQEIIEQYRAEGAAERDKIIAEARGRAEQIVAQADVTIQREVQASIERLKQEVVDAAAQRAQELISENITDTDQDRLVDDFIERVGKLN